jgi:hypothetical protein
LLRLLKPEEEKMKRKLRIAPAVIFLGAVLTIVAPSTFAQAAGPRAGRQELVLAPLVTAEQAVQVVRTALPKLEVGKFWIWEGPRGDAKSKVALTLDGRIVTRFELNPVTGEILANGQDVFVNQNSQDPNQAVAKARDAVRNLQAAAARMGPEGEWKVELILNSAAVAEVDVNSRDGSILTDWGSSREATLY